jgi:TetR/AcrR family transcriptional repressor of nem operon
VTTIDTRQTIMNAARAMVQYRGYNALSFREIAKEVGVKSASIHYHFPTKGDLATALARRYTDDLAAYLDGLLSASQDVHDCIDGFTGFFRGALLKDNRMCLCGILAAEHVDLPTDVRAELERFTQVCVRWLVKVLSLKKSAKGKAVVQRQALAIFAAVEGAQLVARSRGGDVAGFDQTIEAYRTAGLLP